MKEGLMKKLYDKVDNQWEFVISASNKYDEEFKKTAKIGEPPKIEDIMEKVLNGSPGESEEAENSLKKEENKGK